MAKPKQEEKDKEYLKDTHFLYEILNRLKNVKEVKTFLKELLTPSEMRMLKRRWHIACLLDEGWDARYIANKAKVSTQTVMRVKRVLEEGRGGLKLALERTKGERLPQVNVPSEKSPWIETSPRRPVKSSVLRWVFGTGRE